MVYVVGRYDMFTLPKPKDNLGASTATHVGRMGSGMTLRDISPCNDAREHLRIKEIHVTMYDKVNMALC